MQKSLPSCVHPFPLQAPRHTVQSNVISLPPFHDPEPTPSICPDPFYKGQHTNRPFSHRLFWLPKEISTTATTRNPSIVLDLKTISWATYFMLIDMKRRASLSACSQEIKKIVAASDSYVKWPILAELGLVWLCSLNPSVTWT